MGTRLGIFLLALVTVVAAESTALAKARLTRASRKSKFRFAYALPAGTSAVEKPAMRKARLGKDECFFFDVDGNGKWNDIGVDAWALRNMPYSMPLEASTIIGASTVTWRVEEDGSFVHYALTPLPITPKQRDILIQFNTWRMMNGLPAVTVDPKLSAACLQHCEYMEKHGLEHAQKPGEDGYTAEGAAAGKRSCISEAAPKESVHTYYASFYHRLPLIHPGTRAIGIGATLRYSAIDGLTMKEPRPWQYPIIIPAPNTFAHPTLCARERPRPHPAGIRCGFPITMTFQAGTQITDVEAKLYVRVRKKDHFVPTLVSWPGRPANKKRPDNRASISVIPTKPLLPRKTYRVKVSYKLEGKAVEREWLFNTGAAGPRSQLPRR